MGHFFKKLSSHSEKEDPIITALRSLGSKNEDIRRKAREKLLNSGPEVIPGLFLIIDNSRLEGEWLETDKMLDKLDYSTRRVIHDLINDLNSSKPKQIKAAGKRLKKLPEESQSLIKSMAQIKKSYDLSKLQRNNAISLLAEISIPPYYTGQAIQVLIKAAAENSADVSGPAEKALERFGSLAEPYLLISLKGADNRQSFILLDMLKALKPCSTGTLLALESLLPGCSASCIPKILELLEIIIKKKVDEGSKDIPEIAGTLAVHLSHNDPKVRAGLTRLFWKTGPEASSALPDLYGLLEDDDDSVRSAAATAISCITPDENGIPALMKALSIDSWNFTRYITASLASLGKAVIPHLMDKLNVGTDIEKRNAIDTLGLMKQEISDVLPVLEVLLEDENAAIRIRAIKAVGNLGPSAACLAPKLIDIWKQSGEKEVMYTLCKLNEPFAIDMLLKSSFDSPRSSVDSIIKENLMKYVNPSVLTEEIISWALLASTYDHEYSGMRYDAGWISLANSTNAIKRLINIKSPVTSNILHLAAGKKDVSVCMDNGCGMSWDEHVSFKEQREMALEELSLRGNPPYDSAMFAAVPDSHSEEIKKQIDAETRDEKISHYNRLMADAIEAGCEFGDRKWSCYNALVKEYKNKEVFKVIVSGLQRYRAMSGEEMSRFISLLTDTADALDDQTMVSLLSPIQLSWPDIYSQVLRTSRARKRG